MTLRARWLALLSIGGGLAGSFLSAHTLAFLSLTMLLWLGVQWTLFQIRIWYEIPRFRIQRTINGQSAPPKRLWAGRHIEVETQITPPTGGGTPLLFFRDCIPENLLLKNGSANFDLLDRAQAITIRFRAQVVGAGTLTLPGVRLVATDPFGFFEAHRFLALEHSFKVMPAYTTVGEIQPIVKRINAIPLHGIHRLKRSGPGAELLELREYVPGDPPKSIAWKASARREHLMTRQYESEVPVRVRMFIDGSISTRTGGFGARLIDQMIYVASSIARSATNIGDPIGATLFDERGHTRISTGGGERKFYQLLDALADFADNPTPPRHKLTKLMVAAALRLAGERYPELLDPRINRVPFTLFPLSPWKRARFFQQTTIAHVMAERYHLSPVQLVELMYDEQQLSVYLQRFLLESGVAWMDPLVSQRDRGFHDGLATMEMLSRALTEAVATARDNEVYVVMANLLECSTNISQLLPAVKTALSRHHRVVFIVPTPNFRRPSSADQDLPTDPAGLLERAEEIRTVELQSRLQQALHRVGARVALSGEEQAVRMVLSETALTRSGRTARAGGAV